MTDLASPPPPQPSSTTKSSLTTSFFAYPAASSPDIIRSHQKDIYLTSNLSTSLTDLTRRFYGARFAHNYSATLQCLSELLYFSLTTLVGNRTLGEEYVDVTQVEARTGKLPGVEKRAGYIFSAVLVPYLLGKALPRVRSRVRESLEASLAKSEGQEDGSSQRKRRRKLQRYLLQNLGALTSTAPVYAISLAVFYFSGSYYHLSKRLWGLRYVFSKKLAPSEQRAGYEVLGVLLVMQIAVQTYLHVQEMVSSSVDEKGVEVAETRPADSKTRIAMSTHTPLPPTDEARYDLAEESRLGWLQPQQQRKCTLCLEPMKDPSVTTCGHVFCWTCILDWVRERQDCPLCRQATLAQHVLPLRG
ncbi:uncharacterized protein KY384_009025 [Bacidia gigantensis]|uniref:uncharacterized protein n=1 Tax=Bacidia gigantensis TaxID=2732470 RepID=UPI001D051157|nr:uncharacterized protein KY384_009025 [Bacidia gigantensis]KAG8525381.1 hypothetical protein KY384_009025 [Bacidia gigantensis]